MEPAKGRSIGHLKLAKLCGEGVLVQVMYDGTTQG